MADELSDVVKARKDLLWGLYGDVRLHARHAETLRSTVVNFMVVIASVLLATILRDGRVGHDDLVVSLALAFIGFLALMFAASYTELHERNRRRAMRLRAFLDEEFFAGGVTMESLLAESDRDHEASVLYRRTRKITGSTQHFWFVLPGIVLVAGVVLTVIAV